MTHILGPESHKKTYEPFSKLIALSHIDIVLFKNVSRATITGAILPSGLKVPDAPSGFDWIVTSPNTIELLKSVWIEGRYIGYDEVDVNKN